MTPHEMRARALRYRAMMTAIDDALARKALLDLANHYEAVADEADARESGTDRAPDKEKPDH